MGGVDATTKDYLILAAGAYVKVDGVDIGALSGDVVVRLADMERYFPELFGVKGKLKDTGHIIRAEPEIEVTMTEWLYANLQKVAGGIGASSDANSEWLGSGTLGKLASTDYFNIEILGVTRHDTKAMIITLTGAYVSDIGEVTLSDSEDTFLQVTFRGTYAPTTPTLLPLTIAVAK